MSFFFPCRRLFVYSAPSKPSAQASTCPDQSFIGASFHCSEIHNLTCRFFQTRPPQSLRLVNMQDPSSVAPGFTAQLYLSSSPFSSISLLSLLASLAVLFQDSFEEHQTSTRSLSYSESCTVKRTTLQSLKLAAHVSISV